MKAALTALAMLAALLSAGCGDDSDVLVVGVAASLDRPLAAFAEDFEAADPGTDVRIEVAGSDTLAARIRQGVAIDVLVSASTVITDALHREGLIADPERLAGNELVVAARRESEVRRIEDLDSPGLRLAIGQPDVPVGAYARDALSLVGDAFAIRAMGNVRTNELDARGLVGKVELGVVDAAIMYRTDARLLGETVRVIPFAAADQPGVTYAVAAVSGAPGERTEAFIAALRGDEGRAHLVEAGFLP